jgi:pilus assembly protein CpaC
MILRTSILLTISVAAFGQAPAPSQATASRDLAVTVGKSVLVDSVPNIERVSVANGDLAEAVAITPHEVLVNGKAAGETSLIVWQQGGNRLFFDLTIQRNEARVDAIRREIMEELGNQDVTIELQDTTVFVRGTVKNLTSANRAIQIASTLGRPVNLLRVAVPETDAQILLKVKFADVDRSTAQQLGINFFSTGAGNTPGTVTTGQFSPPQVVTGNGSTTTVTLSNALNVFLFRPDLNLGATIAALQSRNLLQILAEPNVLAINGHNASFLAGGEFPYPTLQGGGGGLGAVTIQFREFGVRINFTPVITPRGTIRLAVTPEVSSLDYANGLVFQGFTIPGLSTRRVQTEIELNEGQSFAIGGLLDNRDTETFNRIPGLGDIPFFGKLFRSRQINRSNTELIVMVTPELVRPMPRGEATPDLNRPGKFLPPNTSSTPPQTPGPEVTGTAPLSSAREPIPVEDLLKSLENPEAPTQAVPQFQYLPVPLPPVPQGGQPAPQGPAPATPPAAAAAPNQNPQGR